MIGVRAGLRCGVVGGSRNGSGVDELGGGSAANPMAGVAQDATSSKYMPANAAQWTTTMAAAGIATGNPSLLWLHQDAASPIADAIGSFTGTAASWLFQQTVAGWTAKGMSVTTPGATRIIQSVAAGLPDISTTSCLLLTYHQFPVAEAPGAGSFYSIATLGPTFGAQAAANVNNTPKLVALADPNSTIGTADPRNAVRPVVVKVNRTGAAFATYSDQEKLTAALTATPTGKAVTLGGDGSQFWTADGGAYLYTAAFFAGAAELTDANVRSLLQTLGWSVAW